ncbi:helix-turn-helix domain-containing protein [Paenibacillus sp. LMG 31461]|uniref:Helix-turn-helix domain-containing protein n=1 Tax=Paenibacillus plantarum TaxID=2654975 RepID=A0ABX1X3T1_9BACL|nr:AraC family transcriptional regulator [Paenibacillus plantarum]NOU62901.1 helix-turn-helix domain-containing protein [Paenibacillus plantarum]
MTNCLQLRIPPLPQFLTIGFSIWPVGAQHFGRTFDVYDLLLVRSGMLHMTEESHAYDVGPGEMLLLEPGISHIGHKACEEPTEIYWVHFKHEPAISRLPDHQISWSVPVREGRDSDLAPQEQYLYVPKFSSYDQVAVEPILEEMLRLRSSLTMEYALNLQQLLGRLLSQLQASLRSGRLGSRSSVLAAQVMRYLEVHLREPYHAAHMEQELHFNEDYAARCLRKHTGLSPLQYHHVVRMEEAKRLLSTSELSLQEVGDHVGYEDYNYFIRVFRKTVGCTPSAFRRSVYRYV